MIPKSSLPVLAVSLMATVSAAAPAGVSFTAWSESDCGADEPKAFTEESNEITTWKMTPETIKCASSSVSWDDWPVKNGRYTTFIDSKPIEEDCQLLFYDLPPKDDDYEDSQCFIPYRSLDSTSGCAIVSIPVKF